MIYLAKLGVMIVVIVELFTRHSHIIETIINQRELRVRLVKEVEL